jgi:hypothetical protein
MKLQEFNENKNEIGIEGTGISSTVRETLTWKNVATNEVIYSLSPGDKVQIYFSPKNLASRVFIIKGDFVGRALTTNAHKYFTGFTKPPTIKTLEKRMFDGVSKSVTGKTVEPDGYGPDGSPSWELCLGLI